MNKVIKYIRKQELGIEEVMLLFIIFISVMDFTGKQINNTISSIVGWVFMFVLLYRIMQRRSKKK